MLELDGRQEQLQFFECVLLIMGYAIMTFTTKVTRSQTRLKSTCYSRSPYMFTII